MRALPTAMIPVLAPFAPLFSERVWQHAQVLLMGAILAPGQRTVGSALRALGIDQQKRFHRYHRVLSRATWSPMEASRVLLGALVETRSCQKEVLWWWASMRRWNDVGGRRSLQRGSTETRCSQAASASSRGAR
jgi:hypothetical protein